MEKQESYLTELCKFTFSFFLLLMIRSSPLKAPDATNRMFVVSTCTVSPLSFLEFFSGTLTIVPSKSLSNPWQRGKVNTWVNQYRGEKLHKIECWQFHCEINVYKQIVFRVTWVEYWPAGLPLHLHLSAGGFQGRCQSYQPRPETQYLHMKNKDRAKAAWVSPLIDPSETEGCKKILIQYRYKMFCDTLSILTNIIDFFLIVYMRRFVAFTVTIFYFLNLFT